MKNNIDNIYTSNILDFSKKYIDYLRSILERIDILKIKAFTDLLLEAQNNKSQIFFIGNGGSASTASHFANDLSIGCMGSKTFRAISLCDNQAIITAIANDFGYSQIFVRQLQAQAFEGDVVVAISASGNSKNLVEALHYANEKKMKTFSLVAFTGGKVKEISHDCIHIPTNIGEYGPAEDCHLVIDHLVSSYLIRLLKNGL